ncbi:MAG: 50S ribosomal protein L23 [Deltaproteobacteria bacterium]|jgi:large subunit ribosomal protein L23|nr:50S ribosomal protein L23 [Deltaproteobacteria bacterium]MBW2415180.1 50S ribosomal protein L23 [Deltaproteobacteria bacterium]
MNVQQVIRRPLITEKSTIERELQNIVTFEVDPRANKTEIRNAVETLFDVQVLEVRTSSVKGKKRRVGRNVGYRPNWKKARVKLREGDSIEFFEGV